MMHVGGRREGGGRPAAGLAARPPFDDRMRLTLLLIPAICLVACGESSRPGEPLRVLATIGESGTFPGQFNYPRAMATGEGDLFVVDKTARIQRIDPASGGAVAWFTMPRFEKGKPTGLSVGPGLDREPLLYVADTHEHRVMVFELPEHRGEAPRVVASFGGYGTGPGEFIYPTDIAVLAAEDGSAARIYVSEYGGNDRISVFGPGVLRGEDDFLFQIGGRVEGQLDPLFDRPQSISIDREAGQIIVADAGRHRLGRFTLDGALRGWIDLRDEAESPPLDYPYGVLALGGGAALVAEFGGSRLRLIDLEAGRTLGAFGVQGRGEGELMTPWATVRLGERVYVLDSGNNRILAFRPPGLGVEIAGGGR